MPYGEELRPSVQPPGPELNFASGRPTMLSVSQVSLPMRIALGATLAFLALWMVALRPKPPPTQPTATPPAGAQSAPGKAAEQAQQAVGASQESAQKHESAAAGKDDATASGTPAKPVAQDAKKPGAAIDVKRAAGDNTSKAALSVLRDVAGGKVAVLLFWDRRLSDDRAVRTAVKGLSRRGGKVAVHVAPIGQLAKYEPITRGVPVVTSPTVLVIDRAGHARAVGGLSVPRELEELVGKALKVKR